MALASPKNLFAYDFSAVAPSGQLLYYTILSNGTGVSVVWPNSSATTVSDTWTGYAKPTGDLVIPNTVSFNGTTYVVKSIGSAFCYCTDLTSIVIADSVKVITTSFFSCTGLTSVTLGSALTTIGDNTFRECSSLTSVTIPSGVTYIGNSAFYNCSNLSSINIPNSVTKIGKWAFRGTTNLTSITLPNTIDTIKSGTFALSGLTSVNIPSSVVCIMNVSFGWCNNLASVNIPNSVDSIGKQAFNNDSNLLSLTIPQSVTNIGTAAFAGCVSLNSVIYNADSCYTAGEMEYAVSIFNGCTNLTNITFGNTVRIIPPYLCRDLTSLPSVTLPEGLTVIGQYAFDGCTGLTSVTIPSSVTGIGKYAFSCNNLTSVIMKPTIPPYIGSNCFPFNAIIVLNGCSYDNYYEACTNGDYYYTGWWWAYLDALRDSEFSINYTSNNYEWGYVTCVQPHTNYTSCVRCDSTAIVRANANYGCHFESWSNGNTAVQDTLHLTHDSTVTAIFARNSYTLITNVNDANLGSLSLPNGNTALYLDTLMVTAVPVAHHHVASWTGYGIVAMSTNKDTVWIKMADNRSVICNFAIDTHSVVVTTNDIARGMAEASGTEFVYGTPCTVEATAYTGYTFHNWSNGETANPYTFAVLEDMELMAIFLAPGEQTYTVTVSVNNPAMGSVSGGGTYNSGATATLTATANSGYHFDHWQDNNTQNPRTITVTGNATYTAYFAANSPSQYTITVNSANPAMGSVSGGGTYNSGATATLTATANSGYHFTHWQDNNTQNPRTITVTGSATYTAYFEEDGSGDDCPPITTFPWNNTFDASLSCWKTVDADGDGYNWGYYNGMAYSESYSYFDGTNHALNPNNWLISRKIQIPSSGNYSLSWRAQGLESSYYNEHYSVYVSTTGDDPSNFTTVLHSETINTPSGVNRSVSLQNYHGQTIRIAFRHHNSNDVFVLGLSNIKIAQSTQGIDDVDVDGMSVYAMDGRIVVEGEFDGEVCVYDMMGRKVDGGRKTQFDVPVAGVYLVRVGDMPAKRVVVIR